MSQPGVDSDSAQAPPSSDASASVEESDSEAHRRSQRKTALSLRAKESKVTELTVQLASIINSQLPQFESELSAAVEEEDYDALLVAVERGADHVSSLYQEIVTLEDNKVLESTQQLFSDYETEIAELQVAIHETRDHAERELERQIQETQRKLQEQMEIFQQRKQRRASLANSRSETERSRQDSSHQEQLTVSPAASSVTSTPIQNIQAPVTNSQAHMGMEIVKQFTTSLEKTIDRVSTKRSVDPDVFTGDVFDFKDWEVDLDSYLRVEGIEGKDRLRHLKKFVGGEAKKCISGHFEINTNESYDEARRTLKERYGNKRNVIRTFRRRLADWPSIRGKDGKGLREYGDFLSHITAAAQSHAELSVLDDEQENKYMCDKLPDWLTARWYRRVDRAEQADQGYPKLVDFTRFIQEEARVLIRQTEGDIYQMKTGTRETTYPPKTTRTLQSTTESAKRTCLFCDGENHDINRCFKFLAKPYPERVEIAREKRVCFGCLKGGHLARQCQSRSVCKTCQKPHPTALHDPDWKGFSKNARNSTSHSSDSKAETESPTTHENVNVKAAQLQSIPTVAIMAVPVYISAGCGKETLVYAMLDTQSDACFVTKEIAAAINATGESEDIIMNTLNGETKQSTIRYKNLTIRGYLTQETTNIDAYEQHQLSCNKDQLPTADKAMSMDHLQDIADRLPPLMDVPVGLLIGMDCPQALTPLSAIPGKTGEPFAMETMFGWTLCGGRCAKQSNITISKVEVSTTELVKAFERDFIDTEHGNQGISQNDMKFLQILEAGTRQSPGGNYTLPLPLTNADLELPNNRVQAHKRLDHLIKKLKADTQYCTEYTKFMDDLIMAGHAEEVPIEQLDNEKVWYMPHFAVRHPKKKKIRVVFDASAKYEDISLNDVLLTGPDHMNSLLGILLRFRKEPIALSCDIEKMFYNFFVEPEQRDYLRFLWVDETFAQRKEYRMTVHLFGATSSPGVATFGLRQLAKDYSTISPAAARFLEEDFYVDDGVTSVATQTEAKELIEAAITICSKGNVRLHKFLCSDKEVLATVPESERSESTQRMDIFKDRLPSERTLGMEWCLDSDTFHYTSPVLDKPATKRGMLSTTAQIYDPMGLISPVILRGKQILQKVTAANKSWDELVTPDIETTWNQWTNDVCKVSKLHIKRCIKAEEQTTSVELHHFSDASTHGYGACSYLRQITKSGKVTCDLILAKARVAPIKPVTIPRLELQGAVTATRLATILRKELKVNINKEFFWTDSKIALGYIANDIRRFHLYVANRVQEIKETTNVQQWHYVKGEDNPADVASRGATATELMEDSTWFEGPAFLKQEDLTTYLTQNEVEKSTDELDPEVRKLKTMSTSAKINPDLTRRFGHISSFSSLIRSIAILKSFAKAKGWKVNEITAADLKESEEFVVKTVQQEQYRGGEKEPSLAKLNPLKDPTSIIRVGGRANAARGLSDLQKHPAIIPKASHLAYLITKHFHEKTYHLGRRSTVAAIRDAGYWVINATGQAKSIIGKCVSCARLRKGAESQQMGQLPPERLEHAPPFSHIGMDVFGHYIVKDRRTELKRWGLLITCLYSRAIHVEILEDLTTDSLINALRCFMAVRGPVSTIYCDNGTNFVGAKNEIQKEIERASEGMKAYLRKNHITFKFNSPEASHQGGVWERKIRSVRSVLDGMALKYKCRMDTQTLRTAFLEAACIVNSRPLTATDITNPEECVITPNHLLTMKTTPLLAPPPGSFPSDEIYGNKRWKKAQQFAQEFWSAWKADYMQQLAVRQKWKDVQKNIEVGDVVILKDEAIARNCWKIGIVTKTEPGGDGLVRNVEVQLGNRHLDRKGKMMSPPMVLRRPVQKLILLVKPDAK